MMMMIMEIIIYRTSQEVAKWDTERGFSLYGDLLSMPIG
jgi:hypothetical protein